MLGRITRAWRALTSNDPFDGAKSNTRSRFLYWRPTSASANGVLLSLPMLRNRSRDLGRNDPLVAGGLLTWGAELVGTGIKPQSLHPDPQVRKAIHELWSQFVDEADADGVQDLYGLQNMGATGLQHSGEVFYRLRPRRLTDGLKVPLQIQAIEADHCPVEKTEMLTGGKIVAGIEFDAINARRFYHLYRDHPGDPAPGVNNGELVKVPAAAVVHVFNRLRPGQVRGIPLMASVIAATKDTGDLDLAMLKRADVAARFAGFIRRAADGSSPLDSEADDDDVTQAAIALGAGELYALQDGEEITFSNPPEFGSTYGDMKKGKHREIAAGMAMTYEQYTNDLTGVNFSSGRLGLQRFRRVAEQIQHGVIAYQFCRPVFRAFMDAAVLAGALTAPGYVRDPGPYLKVKWVPQGWPYIQPEVDVKTDIMAIRGGLSSRSDAVSQRGADVEALDTEIAADSKRADDLGLVFDSDPRRVSLGGIAQSIDPTAPSPQPAKE